MPKNIILPAGIVLAGLLVIAALVVSKPTPEAGPVEAEPEYVSVAVTPAKLQNLRLAVTAQGTVAPKREIDLITQVSGQIIQVEPAFVDGGFFDGSQVLIQIDDRDYQVALLNAQAGYAEAAKLLAEEEGRSRQAKKEWRDLGNKNANDLFLRKPQLVAAQANLASAKGGVDKAKLDLERTKIVAPFEGRVKQTHADLGQFVSAGTRVATVYDSTVVEVRLPLTEKQVALIDLPLTSSAKKSHGKALASVKIRGSIAGEAHEWQGVLARSDAFVDANSRMYNAVVEVNNPFSHAPLLPGLFVQAEIVGKQLDGVMVLPREALYQRDKIVTLDETNKVSMQTVNVLRKSEGQIWVQAKLKEETLISLEKQSLTPSGTIVVPLVNGEGEASDFTEIASTAAPKE